MGRSLRKGPFVAYHLLKKVNEMNKTDKKTVAVGSGNKNQTPSSSKPDAAAKIPPSVSVSKTNKSSNMVSKPKAPNSSGAASLQPCKPKLFSAATPSGPMNPASKSKLLPSTSSKSGGAKSASALAIENIYRTLEFWLFCFFLAKYYIRYCLIGNITLEAFSPASDHVTDNLKDGRVSLEQRRTSLKSRMLFKK